MAKCPHCHKVLSDAWVKRTGAALMGKAGGEAKARSNAQAAANKRWENHFPAAKEKKKFPT